MLFVVDCVLCSADNRQFFASKFAAINDGEVEGVTQALQNVLFTSSSLILCQHQEMTGHRSVMMIKLNCMGVIVLNTLYY